MDVRFEDVARIGAYRTGVVADGIELTQPIPVLTREFPLTPDLVIHPT